MGYLSRKHLGEVGDFVSDSPSRAISLTTLAKYLGTTFPTAQRRLKAYATSMGLELAATTIREGKRGKESRAFYLRRKGDSATGSPALTRRGS